MAICPNPKCNKTLETVNCEGIEDLKNNSKPTGLRGVFFCCPSCDFVLGVNFEWNEFRKLLVPPKSQP